MLCNRRCYFESHIETLKQLEDLSECCTRILKAHNKEIINVPMHNLGMSIQKRVIVNYDHSQHAVHGDMNYGQKTFKIE